MVMPALKLNYKTNLGSEATFDGWVVPKGVSGYKFYGTLKAVCHLVRGGSYFKNLPSRSDSDNLVRLGHGGSSGDYTYLEYKLTTSATLTLEVQGEGTRASNEALDFRLGFNEELSGDFVYGDKTTVAVAPFSPNSPQEILPIYICKDSFGNTKYDVRFKGEVYADGPAGFLISGGLSASSMPGAISTQYACFGYKAASGSWQYKTCAISDTDHVPLRILVWGSRKAGEKIKVVVGATSEVANLYGYGEELEVDP
jgi:hypothetical protein